MASAELTYAGAIPITVADNDLAERLAAEQWRTWQRKASEIALDEGKTPPNIHDWVSKHPALFLERWVELDFAATVARGRHRAAQDARIAKLEKAVKLLTAAVEKGQRR